MLLSTRQFPLKSRWHVYYSHPWWQLEPTNRPNDSQVGQSIMRLNTVNHIEEIPMCKLYTWSLWSTANCHILQSWLIPEGRLYDDIWGSGKNRRIICWELDVYSRRLSCNESDANARHNLHKLSYTSTTENSRKLVECQRRSLSSWRRNRSYRTEIHVTCHMFWTTLHYLKN